MRNRMMTITLIAIVTIVVSSVPMRGQLVESATSWTASQSGDSVEVTTGFVRVPELRAADGTSSETIELAIVCVRRVPGGTGRVIETTSRIFRLLREFRQAAEHTVHDVYFFRSLRHLAQRALAAAAILARPCSESCRRFWRNVRPARSCSALFGRSFVPNVARIMSISACSCAILASAPFRASASNSRRLNRFANTVSSVVLHAGG